MVNYALIPRPGEDAELVANGVPNVDADLACHVPLNDQLAAVAPAQEAALWSRYLDVWTAWNHVRTIAPIVSAILFTAALCLA
jgi:uncharacterized membrane protein